MTFRVRFIMSIPPQIEILSSQLPSTTAPNKSNSLKLPSHDGPSLNTPLEAPCAQLSPLNASLQASTSNQDALTEASMSRMSALKSQEHTPEIIFKDTPPTPWGLSEEDFRNNFLTTPSPISLSKQALPRTPSHPISREKAILAAASSDSSFESKPNDLLPAHLGIGLPNKDSLNTAFSQASLKSLSRQQPSREDLVKAHSPREPLLMTHFPQHSTQKARKSPIQRLLEPVSKPLDSPSIDASKSDPLRASTDAGDDPTTGLGIDSRHTNLESNLALPFCARVEKAVRSVMSSSLDPAFPHLQIISCFCEWELPAFMQKEFDCHQRISDVVTLVGTMSPYNARATTCSEYIYQSWPDGGPILLAVIQKLFESDIKRASKWKTTNKTVDKAYPFQVRFDTEIYTCV